MMISPVPPETTRTNQSKYNAQRTGGFDSKLEERRYYQLKADPHVVSIEVHPVFKIFPETKKCPHCKQVFHFHGSVCPNKGCGKKLLVFRPITYIADFQVTYCDGRIEIEDVKGKETEVFRIKRKLFEAAYPDLTLSIVTSTDMKKVRAERHAEKVERRKEAKKK